MAYTFSFCIQRDWRWCISPAFVFLYCFVWNTAITYGQFSPYAPQTLYGVYVHWASAIHTANFHTLAGTSLSQENTAFTSGSGRGSAFGIAVNIPFSSAFSNAAIASRVHLGLRVGYQQHDGRLQAQRDTLVFYQGRPVTGLVQHTIKASIASVIIEPLLGFSPFGGVQFHIGGQMGIPLSTAFIHDQKFIRPAHTTTEPTLIAGADEHGDITDVPSVRIATIVGISHAFPLDTKERLFFIPEVFVSIPISNVSQSVDWSVSTVRAGVQILYTAAAHEPPVRDTIIQRDTVERVTPHAQKEQVHFADASISIQIERESKRERVVIREQYIREYPEPPRPLAPALTWYAVQKDAEKSTKERPLIVEILSTQQGVPLLPFVFFDSASSNFPSRYTQLQPTHTNAFGELPTTTMPTVHRDILNIAGKKMRDEKTNILTVTGCGDGLGERHTSIAQQRAERVRDYLVHVWGIASTRIQLQTRIEPAHPSNSVTPEGAAENRRVELTFGNGEKTWWTTLLKQELILRTRGIILQPTATGNSASWQLILRRNGKTLYSRSGIGTLPDTLVWNPDSTLATTNPTPIMCTLSVWGTEREKEESTEIALPVAIVQSTSATAPNQVYPLLLFPFGEATLSQQQKDELLRRVHATPADELVIIGSTDGIGDVQYNRVLSLARAKSVAQALSLPNVRVQGLGNDGALYDNTLPEGRFYNRMVRIEKRRE